MDFILYLFMFPVAILIATIAMMSGIAGAALFLPIFFLLFPLLGAKYVLGSAVAAIAVALLTSTFGFISGSLAYYRKGLIDFAMVKSFAKISIPAAIVGAIICPFVNDEVIRFVYGVLILMLAYLLMIREEIGEANWSTGKEVEMKTKISSDGKSYHYRFIKALLIPTALGGFITGLLSVGTGEAVMPQLIKKGAIPIPVAAATSVLIVFLTFLAASITHVSSLVMEGGINAVPWHLVCYTVPGVIIGGQIGPRLQGKFDPGKMTKAIAIVFTIIGMAMILIVLKNWM